MIFHKVYILFCPERLSSASWDTTAPDYNFTSVLEASSPSKHQLGEGNKFVGRLRGFFVPPRTGDYQFKIVSDDNSILYISLSGDPNDKVSPGYSLTQQDTLWMTFKEREHDLGKGLFVERV